MTGSTTGEDDAVKTCIKCDIRYEDNVKFCPSCGDSLPEVPGSQEDPYIGRVIARNFRVIELVGVGGMGRVYKAIQLSLDKVICLKILWPQMMADENMVRRFQVEARAASRLNHPNSISIIDFGQAEDGSLFIAMEFLKGRDLGKVIRDEFPLDDERMVKIISQVAAALTDAHSLGIIHRDLKPENIMILDKVDEKDFVKVLDFGIAKLKDPGYAGLTVAGMVCGTPEYMSPEQARGEELDNRSDIYSLGVILYQMAVGEIPFQAPTPMGIVTKHITESPIPPRQLKPDAAISPQLEGIILRAMEKDRDARFSDVFELRASLLSLHAPPQPQAAQPPPQPPKKGATQTFAVFTPPPQQATAQRQTTTRQSQAAAPVALPPAEAPQPVEQQAAEEIEFKPRRSFAKIGTALAVVACVLVAAGSFVFMRGGKSEKPAEEQQHAAAPPESASPSPAQARAGEEHGKPSEPKPVALADVKPAEPARPKHDPRPVARKRNEKSALDCYQKADELFVSGKLDQAIEMYRRTLSENPSLSGAHRKLGMCYMKLGKMKMAVAEFKKYVDRNPKAPDVQHYKSLIKQLEK